MKSARDAAVNRDSDFTSSVAFILQQSFGPCQPCGRILNFLLMEIVDHYNDVCNLYLSECDPTAIDVVMLKQHFSQYRIP